MLVSVGGHAGLLPGRSLASFANAFSTCITEYGGFAGAPSGAPVSPYTGPPVFIHLNRKRY